MIVFPNAKINLGLHVIQKRSDGYHDLETVLYPVQIRDAIEINDADDTSCTIYGNSVPGKSADNICLKAYYLIAKNFQLPPQSITLLKNIPVGAGLGGGSADAAFVIRALNDRFSLGMSPETMEGHARALGADCAFFIKNIPVYAFEKGDRFEPVITDLSQYQVVVVMPEVHVSTHHAYQHIVPKKPLIHLKEALKLPLPEWKQHIKNDFEEHIFKKHPIIKHIKDDLYARGAIFALMSGSGASVFGIFKKNSVPQLKYSGSRIFYT